MSVTGRKEPATLLDEDAEELDGGWTVGQPTEPAIQPWQASDSSTTKVRGDLRHRGDRSFWTGVAAEDQEPGVGPGSGVSALTTPSVALPARKHAFLTYWSDFANDANDFARVEVAVDDGSGNPLRWDTVDSFGRDEKDEYTLSFQETAAERGARFERRTVDLSQYAGRTVRLRFSYVLGTAQFVNVWRTGWYVDDISIVATEFRQVGTTTAQTFQVTGRRAGTYLYRVRAELTNGTRSGSSNVEKVQVTVGRNG